MSWPLIDFRSVCDIQGGTQPPKSVFVEEPKCGYIRLLQIQDFKRDDKAVYVPEKKTLKTCSEKDILIGRYGASIGKILTGLSGAYNVALVKIVFDETQLSRNYLWYYLNSPLFQNFILNVGGRAAQAGFNKSDLGELKIPLPPLPEQKRIAAILDKADAIRRKRQQAIQLSDQLLRTVFLEMFGDPVTNPKGWEVCELGGLVDAQLGKMLSKKAKQGVSPKKYLRNANIRWRYINISNLLNMDFTDKEQHKFSLKDGDLLVCEGGEVGRCAIWRGQVDDCYFQKALHRLRPKERLSSEYLQEVFYWLAEKNGLSDSVSEVTFAHLTAEKLKRLNVPVPSKDMQDKFSEIYKKYGVIKSKHQIHLDAISEQFSSLSQKAFAGKL